MGAVSSCSDTRVSPNQGMPAYYIENAKLSDAELESLKASWDLVTQDKAAPYLQKVEQEGVAKVSCLVWFYDSFYERLFEIYPELRVYFQNSMKQQGKALVGMISMALTLLTNIVSLSEKLRSLAAMHAKRGIVAYQYGVTGEVLFWTLEKCLGKEYYTEELRMSWIKVYSIMLSIIVPAAHKEEAALAALGGTSFSLSTSTTVTGANEAVASP